jgi:hypothetical protein
MAIQPRISLVVILLSSLVYPVSGYADGDFADTVISGLRNLDSNVSAIQEKGFGAWLSDHMTDKAWEHIPDLFGDMSDTVKNVQTAGKDDYKLLSGGTNAFSTGYGSFGSSDAAEQEAQQNQNRFWDSLPDEQRAMEKDGLQMSMPEPLQKLADKVETFVNNAQWVGDKLAEIPSAIDDSVASITSRVQGYVADVKSLGLEPGSDNYQAAATATSNGAPAFASDAESPITNDGAPTAPSETAAPRTDESPSPLQAGATQASTAPANDLVADLQSAGWDSGAAPKDSSAINSDDLAALGGGVTNSTSGSNIDTTQLQSDLSDWDNQQAAAQLARDQEKARQDAIARQQEAEESAQRAEAERLAKEQADQADQADQDAANNVDTEAQPKSGGGFWNGLAQTASLTQQLLSLKHGGGGAGFGGSGGDCTPPAATNAVQQCAPASGAGSCQMFKSYASCLARAQAACGSCGSCINAIRSQQMAAQSSAQSICN